MPPTPAPTRVVITGAGSGLGRALARAFAAQGAKIAITDRDLDAAAATLQAVEAAGGGGFVQPLDVTREADFAALAQRLAADWGGLDVLINNAGVATAGTVADAGLAQWQQVLDINLLGCVRGVQALAPMMVAQGRGHIVNVASFAGIANPPGMASYNAAKAAVISLSETLRFEMAPRGVGVTVACPSFFKTRLLETSREQAVDGLPSSPMEGIVGRLMDKATVTADDVARDIVDAVARRRFMVITHADARRLHQFKRLSPSRYFKLARKATAGFLRHG